MLPKRKHQIVSKAINMNTSTMNKLFFTFCLMIAGFYSQAQTKVGVKLSPSLSVNRVATDEDDLSVDSDGVGLRLSFGPIVDIFLKENYYFSTGLLYTPKRAAIAISEAGLAGKQDYKLQYLQIPATIKLYTNELALDKRIYFQFGAMPEIKIHEKGTSEETFIRHFRFFDFSVLAGLGLEYRIGVSSTVFGGITYTRGLVNAATKRFENNDFTLKNDLVSLDFGIKF